MSVVDHPAQMGYWRHEPPIWESCAVCGGPTCWVELDITFMHPECDMYPSEEGDVRIVLGVKEVTPGGAMVELINACASFEFVGPGNTDDWEPGEEVDHDVLAADVINAALALVAEFQQAKPKGEG